MQDTHSLVHAPGPGRGNLSCKDVGVLAGGGGVSLNRTRQQILPHRGIDCASEHCIALNKETKPPANPRYRTAVTLVFTGQSRVVDAARDCEEATRDNIGGEAGGILTITDEYPDED